MANKSKNMIFLFPLSLAVIFFSSIIIIFSPVGKKNIIALPTPTISPTLTPVPWQTYRNEKYSFELQYLPNKYFNESDNGKLWLYGLPDSLVVERKNSSGSDSFKNVPKISSININNITWNVYHSETGGGDHGEGQRNAYITTNGQYQYTFFGFNLESKSRVEKTLATFKFLPDTTTWKTYKNTEHGFEFKYPSNLHILKKNSQNEYYITSLTSSDLKYTKSSLNTDIVSMGTEYKIFFDNKKCNVWSDNFGIYGYGIFNKNTVDSFPANVSYDGMSDTTYRLNIDTDLGCVSLIGEYGQNTIDKSKIEFDQIISTFKIVHTVTPTTVINQSTSLVPSNTHAPSVTITNQIGDIKKAYLKNNNNYIDIDYIQWIDDNSAPNGFIIINDNPLLRTFEVTKSAPISLIDLTGSEITHQKSSFDNFMSVINKNNSGLFWITLNSANQVIEINEQYVP